MEHLKPKTKRAETAARPAPKKPPSRSRQIGNGAAYAQAIEPFRAGSDSARLLTEFVLSLLEHPEWGQRVWTYNYAGLCGVVAPRVDSKGLVVLALYPKRSLRAGFRRDASKPPSRGAWITLPEAYAHVSGITRRLNERELGKWRRRLLLASGAVTSRAAQVWWQQVLLDPEDPDLPFATCNPWVDNFSVKHGAKIRRRPLAQERLIAAIYNEVLVPAWEDSAERTSHHLPGLIAVSATYIEAALRLLGFKLGTARAAEQRIERAMEALDLAGYVTAVAFGRLGASAAEQAGRHVYSYLPGSASRREKLSRRWNLQPRDAITAMRVFMATFVDPYRARFPPTSAMLNKLPYGSDVQSAAGMLRSTEFPDRVEGALFNYCTRRSAKPRAV